MTCGAYETMEPQSIHERKKKQTKPKHAHNEWTTQYNTDLLLCDASNPFKLVNKIDEISLTSAS